MSQEFVSVSFVEITPREAYGLLVETIVPRPIAFVSTISSSGIRNLAPFSFFMLGGSNPPSLAYSPTLNRHGEAKDSLRNVVETGEFVVNTVHREIAEEMNRTSASLPATESEWDIAAFTPLTSDLVAPPRVAESLAQFECKLFQVVPHGNGPTSATYVIGEIVKAHFSAELFENGKIRPGSLNLIGRLGSPGYVDLEEIRAFDLERPS